MYRVTVLLSSFNGAQYLRQQLDSILLQKNVELQIIVRDDGSTDETLEILEEYKNRGLLAYYTGENLKPAKSFYNLMKKAPVSDFYALCDQDDVWLSDKLSVGIDKIKDIVGGPALYCGRPRIVDSELNTIDYCVCKEKPICPQTFDARLIIRNTPGCTFIMNRALLLKVIEFEPEYLEMHDCWIYQICSALGGDIIYDPDVHILYRQHSNNAAGVSVNKIQKLVNYLSRIKQKDKRRSKTAKELLRILNEYLTDEQKRSLEALVSYDSNFINKIRVLTSKKYNTGSKEIDRNFKMSIFFGVF